jgi:hypothetical protein
LSGSADWNLGRFNLINDLMQTEAHTRRTDSNSQGTMARTERSRAPVFVLGCGRSGTKFLYHTLLSAGGFAVYHAESNSFNLLGLRFGNLGRRQNRQKLLNSWLKSKLFQRSGLEREEIEPRVLNECRNAGDFLRILMETIAAKQGVERWAESTPLHLLYMPLIKKLIPEAVFIHIIRDGRDVAVSLNKIGWIRPLPWDRTRSLLAAGLFWKWMVTQGRKSGQSLGRDYIEVHYEDLVQNPRETLSRLAAFIAHDLDYDRIQSVAMGSVHAPNSSFKADSSGKDLSPVGRWKTLLSAETVQQLESAIGDALTEADYPLASLQDQPRTWAVRLMRGIYPRFYGAKLWLKSNTPLGRTAAVGRMGISEKNSLEPGP